MAVRFREQLRAAAGDWLQVKARIPRVRPATIGSSGSEIVRKIRDLLTVWRPDIGTQRCSGMVTSSTPPAGMSLT